jgi:uncharacterized surface protein with fasciclin (FAS1) repeats
MKISVIVSMIALLLMSSCEELPLQKNYSYDGEQIELETGITAYEWIKKRSDKFSWMLEAIDYAEMSSYYMQDSVKYTFLVIDDVALERWANNNGALEITDLDKEKVKSLIKYHIIKGQYSAYDKQCPIEPSFVKTLLAGEDGLLTMHCVKSSFPIYNAADGPVITSGNIMINATYANGSSPQRSSVTSNIITTNGVIHTFSDYCFYKRDVNYIPLF